MRTICTFFSLLIAVSLLGACRREPAEPAELESDLPAPDVQVETQVEIDSTQPPITAEPAQITTADEASQLTALAIPTGPAPLSARVLANANCRSGPGTAYQVIAGFLVEERVDLVGISPDGAWWVARIPEGGYCWLWGQLIELTPQARDLPVFPLPPTPVVPAAGPGDLDYELRLLDMINEERSSVGAAPLTMEPRLVAAARSHSTDMALNGFFDHTGTGGTSFSQRIASQGYLYSAAGETLFAGGDIQACIKMWLESPAQRDTLLSPLFTQVGIGVFRHAESDYGVYVTADYASP